MLSCQSVWVIRDKERGAPPEQVSGVLHLAVRCVGEKGGLHLEHDVVHALGDVVLTACVCAHSVSVKQRKRQNEVGAPKAM